MKRKINYRWSWESQSMPTNILLSAVMLLGLSVSGFASYPRAGYQAELSTVYHNVSGAVTIVDENTILVEHFYYDGGGPAVYFYLGAEDSSDAFKSGIPIGPLLSGTPRNDDELVLHLSSPTTLDGYNAVSVWCADVKINFGSGTFIDPDPLVSWTFDNNSTQSYILNSFSPGDIPFGTVGQENPTLLLRLNQRYEVTLTDTSHPFEVIAKGAASGDDTVLLSMRPGVTGSLETDSTVGWEDNNTDTVAFTLSQSLYDAMTVPNKRPGYRCGIHVDSMRGDFDVCLSLPGGDLNGDCIVDLVDYSLLAATWLDDNITP